jgi:hypothetical protein
VDSNRVVLSAKQKALRINMNHDLYGTFAEIGAGQEVVRHFFRAGGASGTIAKTISAYDKDFSDAIYGSDDNIRYVCEPRLHRMLDHEYQLIEERLPREKHPNKKFFAFSNTVATINYHKTIEGHGWFGMRFQTAPGRAYSTVVVHARFHETDALQQQASIGALGVNLIYGCLFFHKQPNDLLLSLYDELTTDQIEIDTIHMEGPDFAEVDNRLMSLQLVKHGMTDAVIFAPDGRNRQAADVLYKKVNIDMVSRGLTAFTSEKKVDPKNVQVLFEITLNNLKTDGDIDEKDFLDRADILCSLGQTVLISNFQLYYKLIEYFSRYTKKRMGVVLGGNALVDLFNERYYRDMNGGILEAFGIMFSRDLKVYMYPWQDYKSDLLVTTENAPIHPRIKPLYDYLIFNKRVSDLDSENLEILDIYSRKVLKMIRKGLPGWEDMVPMEVDKMIKQNKLFGYTDKPVASADRASTEEDNENLSQFN